MAAPQGVTSLDIDPFSDEFLAEPYPFHERLREAGAVVWLERYGIYASARHAEVTEAADDWQTFCSAAGVGIDDFRRVQALPPAEPHSRGRPAAAHPHAEPCSTARSRPRRWRACASASATPPSGSPTTSSRARHVDAIADIAEAYPLSVFPEAVGLGPDGLENLLPYGTMVFNALRPAQRAFRGLDGARGRGGRLDQRAMRARDLSPDGLGATIWAAVDSGEITAEEAPLLVRSLLSAGLDTTIIGIGNGLYALAANPGQWQALRENPSLRARRLR